MQDLRLGAPRLDDVTHYVDGVGEAAYGYFILGPFRWGESLLYRPAQAVFDFFSATDFREYGHDLNSAMQDMVRGWIAASQNAGAFTGDLWASDDPNARIRALLGGGVDAFGEGFDFYLENPREGGAAAFQVTITIAGEAYLSGGATSVAQARRLLAQLPSSVDGKAVRMIVKRTDDGGTVLNELAPRSAVSQALGALYDDYWSFSKGMSIDDAKAAAAAEGFGFEIGRTSRFENKRSSIIIGRDKLKGGQVNLIELAEEIQHGLDKTTNEASRFLRRNANSGLSPERLNELFHVEHFQRIIASWEAGNFKFLSADDIEAIRKIIEELR